MLDFQSKEIHKGDLVVYIRNERAGQPRLMQAVVEAEISKSIIVQFENGDTWRLSHSHRSFVDGKMNNLVVVPPRPEIKGEMFDFTGYPISVGDSVAFMEAPSQRFSTSLVAGSVLSLSDFGITIMVDKKSNQKHFRKPHEVVVIDHYEV